MRIGIDLGGTKIEALALANDGTELWRQRVATPQGDYSATLASIQSLISELERQLGQQGSVGVGIPGTLSPQTGLVKNANSQCLNGQPLGDDLASLLQRPVRVANDANCLAVSEATDGAGADAEMVFAAILGTGCGAGISYQGKVWAGGNGLGGEWGHNPLPWCGPQDVIDPCFCGRQGCIETFVSGSGFERQFYRQTGQLLKSEAIIAKMRQGESQATAIFLRYVDQLTRALAHVVNLLDPDCIVLGGGMSNISELYPLLNQGLSAQVFGQECHTPVVKNHHGDSSGVRGAAWLWERA
ncbi:fructokinase [Ferrimonas aestuarii]|uniref:Fructokinase n=1 Tax=Ferrimonas aestuarii TaxID=2569539 RepID=A0A4U1BT27_9GAMM|nr:fructokinase [Ferrimonas aestuarii]TKB58540.1 fructokinase [Ferrimonas aestuarii]